MGCNCGGTAEDQQRYLVTLADGGQQVVQSETGARLAITLGGGGTWRQITAEQARELATENATA